MANEAAQRLENLGHPDNCRCEVCDKYTNSNHFGRMINIMKDKQQEEKEAKKANLEKAKRRLIFPVRPREDGKREEDYRNVA